MPSSFTLMEMMATVAGLVIVLGLMASLARYVRHRSADDLARRVLLQLERSMNQSDQLRQALASVPPLVTTTDTSMIAEDDLQAAALANNKAFVRAWLKQSNGAAFEGVPMSLYNQTTLRDAWGTPVVYMAPKALNVGIAPRNRAFFLSAGPDRKFSTIMDNLYSLERAHDP